MALRALISFRFAEPPAGLSRRLYLPGKLLGRLPAMTERYLLGDNDHEVAYCEEVDNDVDDVVVEPVKRRTSKRGGSRKRGTRRQNADPASVDGNTAGDENVNLDIPPGDGEEE